MFSIILSKLTYLPMAFRKKVRLFALFRWVSGIWMASLGPDFLRIACSRPWGATSTITAFSGTCFKPSSNNTAFKRLLVKYWGEQYLASSFSQFSSGTEVEIHLEERLTGSSITWKSNQVPKSEKKTFRIFAPLIRPRRNLRAWSCSVASLCVATFVAGVSQPPADSSPFST